jgi:undecaprenyl-diphosphatase
VAIGGSHWLNVLVKSLVDRPRPVLGDPVQHVGGLSFPSEHAQTAVVAAGVVLLVVGPALGERGRRLLAGACLAGVLTIGFSRVALGAHYPSDILGGYLLGAAWFAGLYCLFARFG